MMPTKPTRVEGLYYNTADMPVFLEGRPVGGHDYVYLEGHLRIPGHFVLVQDPTEDSSAPESFRVAYKTMMEKGRSEKKETHANTTSRKHNIIPVSVESEDATSEDDAPAEPAIEIPKPARTRTARKGKRESAPEGDSSQ